MTGTKKAPRRWNANGATTPQKKEIIMNSNIIARTPVSKPEWATEVEDLGDAGGAVRWVRPVHATAEGDVRVELTQFHDNTGSDAPTVRVWIEGNTLDMIGVDEAKLTPDWLGRLGLELLVGAFRAQEALAPVPLEWERDVRAQCADALVPSPVVGAQDHALTRSPGEPVMVHFAGDENLVISIEDARRYILEAAHVVAIAESL